MNDPQHPFDRQLLRLRRDRAARRFAQHDFLFREVAERLAERLEEVTHRFPRALDLGCHDGLLGRLLGSRGAVETLVQCDLSPALLSQALAPGRLGLVADEEQLPFAPGSFDLVLSALNLHWVNDLPGTLLQLRQTLKPDGLLLAALLGGGTLQELRAVFLEAESELEGGASPRVSPFAEVRDLGGLLQRAGFALPVVDSDRLIVTYPNALALMAELRGMGETNLQHGRRRTPLRRATLFRAAELYQERYASPQGRIEASFQVIYLTAWVPHTSQQQPLKPGSARHSLAEALGSEEHSAGETADPEEKPT